MAIELIKVQRSLERIWEEGYCAIFRDIIKSVLQIGCFFLIKCYEDMIDNAYIVKCSDYKCLLGSNRLLNLDIAYAQGRFEIKNSLIFLITGI